jgi:hypothetical protein
MDILWKIHIYQKDPKQGRNLPMLLVILSELGV